MRPIITIISLLISVGFCATAYSLELPSHSPKTIELAASTGSASTDANSFSSADALEILLRYKPVNVPVDIDVGFAKFAPFVHDSSNTTHIDIEGYLLGISNTISVGRHTDINLGGHIYRYESQAFVQGLDKGSKYDSSASLQINAIYNIRNFSVIAGWRWYQDVSGVEIDVASIGAKVKF